MKDPTRTNAHLTRELERLRGRIAELESLGAGSGRVEQELRESILRQNAILNNIPDIAWLKDRESRFIAVNVPFGEACGVAPADLVGKTDYDIWPRDLAENYRADDAEVMRTGQRKRVEERLVGPYGRESWIETIKTPILDAQGEVIGTTGIARDITDRRKAEEALQAAKEYAENLIETANTIVVGLDTRGNIMVFNQAAETITGYSRSELQNRNWFEILVPKDRYPYVWVEFERLMAKGLPMQFENPILRKSGEERYIVWRNNVVYDHGKIAGTISFGLDVTDRRRAEEALRESEHRYRTLFETMSQGVVYQAADGRIISANPAAEHILGVSLDQMQGRTSMDPRWRAIREDGSAFPGDQHPAMEALGTGKPVHDTIMGVFRPNRNEYRWILVNAVPEFLPGATRPYQVYATFTDITERRRAEEDLRRRTQGLAALLEVSKGLAATLDLGTILQATTDGVARLSGLDTSAVYLLEGDTLRLGATTPPLPPQFPEELRNAPLKDHPHIREAITSGRPLFVPDLKAVELTSAEQAVVEQRGLRTALYLPLLAEEKAVGILIVNSLKTTREWHEAINDLCRTFANLAALAVENARLYTSGRQYAADLEQQIAERKKAEQERLELERRLLHAQKLESLGLLAGGIAHDFNNLLMAVLGNLDLALRKLSPVSPARLNIEHSAQAARRATDLTRQMLAYSGKGRFVVKAMDLSELVEENAHLFRASMAHTATLDLCLARPLPAIEADAGQVQQVIMNLITNASEAIGENAGRITITTGVRDCDAQCMKQNRIEEVPPAGRFVMLEVSDTGCGMDEQTQQRLFDPFFSTKAAGRGLGMSAILGIVRGHGGAIFVESDVGRGSTIRILFPALAEAEAVKSAAVGAVVPDAEAATLKGTVLVVDDEEIVRNVCKEMVQSFGMQVLTASDGREAVEVFRQNADRISHVILDLTMPNMDGMTAFKELVRIRPGAKVILCSGYNEQDSIRCLSGEGLAGFIQKPYSLTKLRDVLEQSGKACG